jgi:glycosyltransferase involved in cell wall biosynthesis
MRILHVPANQGNNPRSLMHAERALGLQSDMVDFSPNYLSYGAEGAVDLSDRSLAAKARARLAIVVRAAARYDLVHYNAGAPIFPVRARGHVANELWMLKRLGKTIVVTWQGCDARPRSACRCERAECIRDDPWRPLEREAMLRHADRGWYLNPDLARWLPGASFLPYANVDVHAIAERPLPQRVAHAPTNRLVKGTADVIAAVERLRGEGLGVELDLIEGIPNAEAMERLAAADVIVDQLVLGWYGGLAVECMALGRPVVCHIDESANPFGERLPVVRATAHTLTDVLRELATDPERRARIAGEGRAFALAEHSPEQVVRRCYEGLIELP